MQVTVDVPDSLVVTAVDGARIHYWAKWVMWLPRELELLIEEVDTKIRYTVKAQAFREALAVMARRYPTHYRDLVAGRGDMVTGDVLIQLAALGEVRYG